MGIDTELIKLAQLKIKCSACSLHALCLLMGLSPLGMRQLDRLVDANAITVAVNESNRLYARFWSRQMSTVTVPSAARAV
jgi:hypothetical protein